MSVIEEGVIVRQEAVSNAKNVATDGNDARPQIRLLIGIVNIVVIAREGIERAQLHPTTAQLLIRITYRRNEMTMLYESMCVLHRPIKPHMSDPTSGIPNI